MSRTLGEVLEQRDNALTPIRIGLALLVLIAHGASLSGLADHPLVGGVGVGTWAVMGFFAISGYLVTQSRSRLSMRRFLVNRAARIFPAFWVANLLTALVAAPVVALLAGTRIDLESALLYPLRNAFLVMNQWTIAGTLDHAPYTDVWNGSLWTLAQEGAWYLLVGVLFLVMAFRRNLGAATALLLLATSALNTVGGVPGSILGAFFSAGMLLYALRDRIPTSIPLLGVAAALIVLAAATQQVVLLAPLPLGYLLLAGSGFRVAWPGNIPDVSYGLYVYAFPVAQVLGVMEVQSWGLATYVGATATVTFCLAHLSWRFVEAPTLRGVRTHSRRPLPIVSASLPRVGAPT